MEYFSHLIAPGHLAQQEYPKFTLHGPYYTILVTWRIPNDYTHFLFIVLTDSENERNRFRLRSEIKRHFPNNFPHPCS